MSTNLRKLIACHGFAILSVGLATKGTLLLEPVVARAPFGLFYAAVALSAWYSGIIPALITTLLSVVAINYFFMPSGHSSILFVENIVLLAVFASVAALISYLTVSRQRAELALRLQESKMVSLMGRISDVFLSVDHNWRVIYMNRFFNGYVGYTINDLTDRVLWQIYPNLSGTRFETECRKAMESRKSSCFIEELAIPGKCFEVHLYPDEDGLSILCLDIPRKPSQIDITD